MPTLLDQLAGGDPRSVGNAAAVAAEVLAEPSRLDELLDGIACDDELIRARASDALEKVSALRPELLRPYKHELLTRVLPLDAWIVRAHACQILPRLDNLTSAERRRARQTVRDFLTDRSSIVKAVALECLVRLALPARDPATRRTTRRLVDTCATKGDTPALRARARKMQRLLAKLARVPRA